MRFITTEKPITTTHKSLGDLSVTVEVPQVDSVEEAVTFAGGTDAFLAYFNNAIETSAKNGGRAMLRNAPEDADLEALTSKVQQVTRDYAPQASGDKSPSKAKKAAKFDELAELVKSGAEFTREQLLEMLSAAK